MGTTQYSRDVMRAILITLGAMFAFCFTASAKEASWIVSASYVAELHQGVEETYSQFLRRVAKAMRDETARSGFEVCGDMCVGPKGHAIMIFTGKSQVMCPVMRGCPLAVPNMTNIFLHTHPQINYIQLNERDVRYINRKRKIFKKNVGQSMTVSPRKFSRDDYKVGPGYMIYRSEIYYQEGRGTQRLEFTLEP